MSQFLYVVRSLFFFWRVNLAVALGVVAATAVLTGALLVGDSMRGSLRQIALNGLGQVDEILLTDRFFDENLADEIEASSTFEQEFERAEAVILFPNASASLGQGDQISLANQVTLIGCRNDFWAFGSEAVQPRTASGELPEFSELDLSAVTTPVVLNEPLAADLGIKPSDLGGEEPPVLTVRIPKPQLINADNPIGKKEDLYETIARLEVVAIVPAESIGRFTLHPSQMLPRILFLPIATVQNALQQDQMANAILVSTRQPSSGRGTTPEQSQQLNETLDPGLGDVGLIFKEVKQTYRNGGEQQTVFEYFSLSSDQLLLTDTEVSLAMETLQAHDPIQVLTYLATGLKLVDSSAETIPFSMVTAIDVGERFPLTSAIDGQEIGPLKENEILINSWAAHDLLITGGIKLEGAESGEYQEMLRALEALPESEYQARLRELVGRKLQVEYFEPEASHGKLISRSAEFVIADIARVVAPEKPFNRRRDAEFDQPPTLANDPDLTPFVPGVTDQNSVNKWDLPFQTEVRPQDDDYWQFYRTTPKAFINLAVGQRLWSSRFGQVTSIRIPAGDLSREELEEKFLAAVHQRLPELGFQFTPIKRRNLKASSGSTPFDVLFLALSFFIIAAALILISLLFRLGVDQKVSQLGLLSAVGVDRRRIARLLVLEGTLIAVVGAALGVLCGVLYAQVMVYGLTTWWVGAVVTSFMEFHWSVQSLVIGMVTGILVSILTIWISVRRLVEIPVRDMMSGKTEAATDWRPVDAKWLGPVAWACFLFALLLLVVAATSLGGESQAGAFMGGGFLMLTSFLIGIWRRLKRPVEKPVAMSGQHLAVQNASRNPLRSTLTIGLVAAATFLIVAVSSFHLSPTEEGTGGFDYLAESSQPIVGDFQDTEVREKLLGEAAGELESLEIYSLRFLPGDEAGCNNPFQAQRPQVLGMTDSLVALFDREPDQRPLGFAWSATTASTPEERQNPWRLLDQDPGDGTVPVVIDKNTAMYSLKIFGVGGTYQVEFDAGQKVTFRVVGFLSNSTLQGSLIIGENQFEKLFTNVTGYRKFLIRTTGEPSTEQQRIEKLETELRTYGFDATDSTKVLASFLAVQNTYLSTFQTLGAFGLLLGTFGLATVQMRNVVERRKELALLRALGFSRQKLGSIVLSEHTALLVAGMLIGTVSALFAVVPHILFGDATVPLFLLLGVLAAILVVGLLSGLGAVVSSVKTPILSALRSDH